MEAQRFTCTNPSVRSEMNLSLHFHSKVVSDPDSEFHKTAHVCWKLFLHDRQVDAIYSKCNVTLWFLLKTEFNNNLETRQE